MALSDQDILRPRTREIASSFLWHSRSLHGGRSGLSFCDQKLGSLEPVGSDDDLRTSSPIQGAPGGNDIFEDVL